MWKPNLVYDTQKKLTTCKENRMRSSFYIFLQYKEIIENSFKKNGDSSLFLKSVENFHQIQVRLENRTRDDLKYENSLEASST